jgi:hypothetical protein
MTRRAVNDKSGRGINVAPSVTRRQRVPVRLLRPALLLRIAFRLYDECRLSVFMAITGVFTPVLAKHSKSFLLIACISIGVDRMQRNFEPMRKQVEAWQRSELTDVTAKVVIYEVFVEGNWRPQSTLLGPCTTSTSSRNTRNSGLERSGVFQMRLPLHSKN